MKRKGLMRWITVLSCGVLLLTACAGKSESYEKAMELAEAGNYKEAESYFADLLKEKRVKADYYIGYGMTLNEQLLYEEAERIFSECLESDQSISKAEKKQLLYGRMVSFYGQGKYPEGIEDAENALGINELEELDRNLLYMEAVSFFLEGESEEAVRRCEALLSGDDSDIGVYLLYGGIRSASGETAEAVDIYEKGIKKDESNYDLYFALYDAYQASGQSAAASELLEKLTTMEKKSDEQILAAGKAWYEKREYDQALVLFEEAYQKKNPKGLFYRGLVKRDQGQLQEAEQDFLSYLSEEKEDLICEVYNQLAGIYMERSEYTQAGEMLSKGIALGDSKAMQNLLRNQVILYELQGNYKKALKAAKAYLVIYSTDAGMQKEMEFIRTRK